ncbi:MAG: hypothetical protein AAFQ94_23835 [Bacteroidota bacterium]
MKRSSLFVLLLLLSSAACLGQRIEADSSSNATNQVFITVHNPLRWLVDEFRVNVSVASRDRLGLSAGWIHPNNILYESFHGMNSNLQLRYARRGFLFGGYFKPSDEHPVYFNVLYRRTNAGAHTTIEVTPGSASFSGRSTFVDRSIQSISVFMDYRKRLGKGRLIHELYAGAGFKIRRVETVYEDQSEFYDKIIPLNYDNGDFISPTINVGYQVRFGVRPRK